MDSANTLVDLVTGSAAAARVLQRHGLDFCCGGQQTLDAACRRAGLDAGEVLSELARESAPAREIDAAPVTPSALVDYILQRYHQPLRPELARLLELADKVGRVHGDKPEWPTGLVAHLELVSGALDSHLAKEEQILFPAIQAGRGHLARMPIQVMISEHDDHGANLAQTRALTGGYLPPAAACGSWRALYQGLEELELDLMKHIHLENNVLFPRVLAGEGGGYA